MGHLLGRLSRRRPQLIENVITHHFCQKTKKPVFVVAGEVDLLGQIEVENVEGKIFRGLSQAVDDVAPRSETHDTEHVTCPLGQLADQVFVVDDQIALLAPLVRFYKSGSRQVFLPSSAKKT